MPMYNFDPAEEQDDLLEQELLDHGREGSLAGPNAKVGCSDCMEVCLLANIHHMNLCFYIVFPFSLNAKFRNVKREMYFSKSFELFF